MISSLCGCASWCLLTDWRLLTKQTSNVLLRNDLCLSGERIWNLLPRLQDALRRKMNSRCDPFGSLHQNVTLFRSSQCQMKIDFCLCIDQENTGARLFAVVLVPQRNKCQMLLQRLRSVASASVFYWHFKLQLLPEQPRFNQLLLWASKELCICASVQERVQMPSFFVSVSFCIC